MAGRYEHPASYQYEYARESGPESWLGEHNMHEQYEIMARIERQREADRLASEPTSGGSAVVDGYDEIFVEEQRRILEQIQLQPDEGEGENSPFRCEGRGRIASAGTEHRRESEKGEERRTLHGSRKDHFKEMAAANPAGPIDPQPQGPTRVMSKTMSAQRRQVIQCMREDEATMDTLGESRRESRTVQAQKDRPRSHDAHRAHSSGADRDFAAPMRQTRELCSGLRVTVVDRRSDVSRSSRKRGTTCVGCQAFYHVSFECRVLFCPKCETLTPVELGENVGAWRESR